eukprot:354058-Chlamydomonas_euryale.AAC.5
MVLRHIPPCHTTANCATRPCGRGSTITRPCGRGSTITRPCGRGSTINTVYHDQSDGRHSKDDGVKAGGEKLACAMLALSISRVLPSTTPLILWYCPDGHAASAGMLGPAHLFVEVCQRVCNVDAPPAEHAVGAASVRSVRSASPRGECGLRKSRVCSNENDATGGGRPKQCSHHHRNDGGRHPATPGTPCTHLTPQSRCSMPEQII